MVEMKGEDYRVVTKTAEFDTLNEILFIPQRYKFERELVFLEGERLKFNTKTQKGRSEDNIVRREKNTLRADFADFDMRKKQHILTGRVRGNYEAYDFNTTEAIIDEYNETVIVNKPFHIENKNENIVLNGREGTYNNLTQEITIEKDAE